MPILELCRTGFIVLSMCILAACATTVPLPPDVPAPKDVVIATPDPAPKPAPPVKSPPKQPAPPPVETPPPAIEIPVYQSPLTTLPFWKDGDHRPALHAFKRTCESWAMAEDSAFLNSFLPEYGTYADWREPCELAKIMPDTRASAAQFFENQFTPAVLHLKDNGEKGTGLLTGYYQPEIDVRTVPTVEFSEPILSLPKNEATKNQPREKINARTSRVIAYGRSLDVFFMQIQGSGHIRFKDGRKIRAAYAGNNGFPYTSIGRILVRRGELNKDRASKRDIENWMKQGDKSRARVLMNENKRYIYFVEQSIEDWEGPLGAMRVPLTEMGSMAVDPRYHPYGTLAYLVVKLPQKPRDYNGETRGQLLVAQDTGKAIRGPLRGDLFFGSGDTAGALAGVMKHDAQWTVLLPRRLAERLALMS